MQEERGVKFGVSLSPAAKTGFGFRVEPTRLLAVLTSGRMGSYTPYKAPYDLPKEPNTPELRNFPEIIKGALTEHFDARLRLQSFWLPCSHAF